VNKLKSIVLTQELKSCISELMIQQKWSSELISKRFSKEAEAIVSYETILSGYGLNLVIIKSTEYKNLYKHLKQLEEDKNDVILRKGYL